MAGENTFFTHEGHLSEAALTAVADGQDSYLPQDVVQHLDYCEHCSARLGEAAFLSAQVAQALAELPKQVAVPAHAPPPRWAIVVIATVAVGSIAFRSVGLLRSDPVGSASMVADAATDWASLPAVSNLIRALQFAAPLVFLCAAVAAGVYVSRTLSRSAS